MGLFGPSPTTLDRGLDAFERRNWKRARQLLEDALEEEGRAIGFYHLGLLYWRGLGGPRETEAAVDCFQRAAADGLPAAETAYGMALRSGVGVAKDSEAARALFTSAAKAGDASGMVELATMSEPPDARHWLLRACEQGHAPAMLHYSDMMMQRDPIEGLAWLYTNAALSADDAARKRAAALAREMTAKEIEAAQKAGRAYLKDIQSKARGR
jgi:TPR repeat protein